MLWDHRSPTLQSEGSCRQPAPAVGEGAQGSGLSERPSCLARKRSTGVPFLESERKASAEDVLGRGPSGPEHMGSTWRVQSSQASLGARPQRQREPAGAQPSLSMPGPARVLPIRAEKDTHRHAQLRVSRGHTTPWPVQAEKGGLRNHRNERHSPLSSMREAIPQDSLKGVRLN